MMFEDEFKGRIFFVESPFQLMCILSDIDPLDRLIMRPTSKKIRDRMLNILKWDHSIENYSIYYSDYRIFKLLYIIIISFMLLISRQTLICIGNFNCKVAQIVRCLGRDRLLVFYDDGSGTFRILSEWDERPRIYFKTIFYNYFTNRQDILRNDIDLHSIKKTISKGEIFIIGTKLSENGLMSEVLYVELLNKVCSLFKNKSVIYCPHGEERLEKFQENNLEVQIENISCPIEEYLMHRSTTPEYIITMGSTAGLSLKLIFDYEVYYLKISDLVSDTKHLPNARSYLKKLESVYGFYKINKLNLGD